MKVNANTDKHDESTKFPDCWCFVLKTSIKTQLTEATKSTQMQPWH